ncbi:MAG TPA: lysylphosphatidylglycerol synthase transmembrane domain-containing protein [Candidatus Paceibacterota bacterium]
MKEFKISKGRLIFYLFSVFVFVFFVYHLPEVGSFVKLFKEVNVFWIIVAIICQVFTYLCIGLMYNSLLHTGARPNITLWELAKLSVVIVFMNHTLPSGGVSGNGFAFHFLVSKGLNAARALSVIILQFVTAYTAWILAIVVALVAYFTFNGPLPPTFYWVATLGIVFFSLLMIFASVVGSKKGVLFIYRRIYKYKWAEKLLKNWGLTTDEMHDSLQNLEYPWRLVRTYPKAYSRGILGYIGVFLFDALTVLALYAGLHISIGIVAAITACMMSEIIGALPISPGSLLVYEGGMTFLFSLVGVPIHAALAVTLMFRGLSFWLPIPIGLFFSHRLVLNDMGVENDLKLGPQSDTI